MALSLITVGAVKAQSDPDVGTWKLNVAKSKYTNMAVPKTDTRTIEKDGDSTKVTVKGVSANGSPIAYGYTSKYDGKASTISGTGINGADSIVPKHVDANTVAVSETRAGKVVLTAKTVVSKDGKTMTIASKGTNAQGEATSSMTIWDKQ
jgi:hypothetical protein